MDKKLGQDFNELLDEAHSIPEVREYLNSLSVIIGDIVLSRRIQLNLSQQELAEKARTTQARISQIESAKGNVRQVVLDRVFNVLGLESLSPTFHEEAAATSL